MAVLPDSRPRFSFRLGAGVECARVRASDAKRSSHPFVSAHPASLALEKSLPKPDSRPYKVLAAAMTKQAKRSYEFGPFRLDAAERILMRDEETVPLTPKALETLLVLV